MMNQPNWAGYVREEWNDLSSTPLASHPDRTHLDSFTAIHPQAPQPVYPGYRHTTTPTDPAIYSALQDDTQMVDSVAASLGELEPHTFALPPHAFDQQYPFLDVPFPPSDSKFLPIPADNPLIPPTFTLPADPDPADDDGWDQFMERDEDGWVCTWTDRLGDTCGYRSRAALVRRHVERVHFDIRYGPSVTKKMYY